MSFHLWVVLKVCSAWLMSHGSFMKIKPFKAQLPIFNVIDDVNSFFETAKKDYTVYLKSGFFKQSTHAAFFVYAIANLNNLEQVSLGIVALTDVEEFTQNNIKKHENTLSKQEAVQKNLLKERNASIKPILLTFKGTKDYISQLEFICKNSEIIIQTDFQLTRHTLYAVSSLPLQAVISNYFEKKIQVAYIADGHHRAYSTMEYLKENAISNTGILTAYFDFSQLRIGAFHRLITDSDEKTDVIFLKELAKVMTISEIKLAQLPQRKGEIVMILNDKFYVLHWKKSVLKKHQEGQVILDTHLLSDFILKPILGIKNLKTDARLKYIEGDNTLEEIIKQCPKNSVLFLMHPISFGNFKTVADSDGILPPKSTFFEPRLINGLINFVVL